MKAFEACVKVKHGDICAYVMRIMRMKMVRFVRASAIYWINMIWTRTLLQLGVPYTNEIDPFRALNYLKQWIMNHVDYSSLEDPAGKSAAKRNIMKTVIYILFKAQHIHEFYVCS
eukprot:944323_1